MCFARRLGSVLLVRLPWNMSERFYLKHKVRIGPQITNEFARFESQMDESEVNITIHFGIGLRF